MAEFVGTYRLKYYLHASHAIRWEKGEGQAHGHSWEIILEFQAMDQEMIVFDQVEQALENEFDQYANRFLNELPQFEQLNPTIEHLAAFFFEQVASVLEYFNARLERLELGESPTRFYCITRKVEG